MFKVVIRILVLYKQKNLRIICIQNKGKDMKNSGFVIVIIRIKLHALYQNCMLTI